MARLRPLLAAALVLLPVAAHAQAHPLVGSWDVEYQAGMRIENDTPTPIMAKATLVVALAGDSLVATLTAAPNPDLPPRTPQRFAARFAAGPVQFVQRTTVTMNRDGEETRHPATVTWRLEVNGNELKGTIERAVEGLEMAAPPGTITGKRAT